MWASEMMCYKPEESGGLHPARKDPEPGEASVTPGKLV